MERLYENERYYVIVNSDVSGYWVINKRTDVIEIEVKNFPEALYNAYRANAVIDQFMKSEGEVIEEEFNIPGSEALN